MLSLLKQTEVVDFEPVKKHGWKKPMQVKWNDVVYSSANDCARNHRPPVHVKYVLRKCRSEKHTNYTFVGE